MIIKKDEIQKVNLSCFNDFIKKRPYLLNDTEHYKLLIYLTNYFNDITIIDAGTCQGYSCISLSQNRNNKIISYDIKINPQRDDINKYAPNVEIKILDINKESPKIINSSTFILLDIDPHDGIQERIFFKKLRDINYKGFVIVDDIHLSPKMKSFWEEITEEKLDLTEIAHVTGTGLVNFSNNNFELI